MGRDEPNLQLPSFRLRRSRDDRRRAGPDPTHEPDPSPRETTATIDDQPTSSMQPPPSRRPGTTGPAPTRDPMVPPLAAAVLAGLVAGLVVVGLSAAALGACEGVRGTSTCGRAGAPLLLAVLAVATALAAGALTLLGVRDALSTSVLAASLVAVLSLLFLSDTMSTRTLLVAVPLMGAAAWGIAHWVTAAYAGERASSVDTTPHR